MNLLPTSNILQRTFRIRFGDSCGTCFTLDVGDRQYIVTARHLGIPTVLSNDVPPVYIYRDGRWRDLPIRVVGCGNGDADIMVMATDIQLSPLHPLKPTTEEYMLGQEVLFLGFPYGLMNNGDKINFDYPIPLVKHAIISAFTKGEQTAMILLDGHNNMGFSGGPVVCRDHKGSDNDLAVIGVISGYKSRSRPVYNELNETSLTYAYNTGIITTVGIEHVIELIESNSIGYDLSSTQI